MSEPDPTSAIARYLDGTMSPSERSSFEQRVTGDPALARRLDAERMIRRAATIERALYETPTPGSNARFEALLDSLPPGPPPGSGGANGIGGASGIGGGWIAAGIGAIAIIGTAVGLFLGTGHGDTAPASTHAPPASVASPTPATLPASPEGAPAATAAPADRRERADTAAASRSGARGADSTDSSGVHIRLRSPVLIGTPRQR